MWNIAEHLHQHRVTASGRWLLLFGSGRRHCSSRLFELIEKSLLLNQRHFAVFADLRKLLLKEQPRLGHALSFDRPTWNRGGGLATAIMLVDVRCWSARRREFVFDGDSGGDGAGF